MDAKSRAEDFGKKISETVQPMTARAKAMGEAAWEGAKSGYANVQEKTVAGAKATDQAIRTHPYQALGIAFGVGLLLGFLMKRK